jgi:Bacterial extracellular solute-binding proteins, family 5 Middle
MRLRLFPFLAAISVALLALPARTARRPRYGGTLRVAIGAALNSLDPASAASGNELRAKEEIDSLLYDHRGPDGSFAGLAGSGAFRIADWQPGKRLVLDANEDGLRGRAFVDSIDIQMGRSAADRLLALELDKADVAEIPPDEARNAAERGVRLSTSKPDELIALVFLPARPATQNARAAEAISRSLDRSSIVNFILQRQGEPAGGLLPQWSSGTAFLFSTAPDVITAKEISHQISSTARIVVGYHRDDALEKAIAERVAVDAREAGIELAVEPLAATPRGAEKMDAELLRLSMPSPSPRESLARFVATLGPLTGLNPGPVPNDASAEQLYETERSMVSSYRIVPLVWIPEVYGLGPRVRNWTTPPAGGSWPFADVWLEQQEQ